MNQEKTIGRQETEAEKAEREAIDDVALRASEEQFFRDIILGASTKLEAIQEVRKYLLSKHPEIEEIRQARPDVLQGSPEFLVARSLVDLVWMSS